jgi:ADP-heptose:LPS heptosyltransferase
LIRPGAIGDLILSLPALEHLRTDYVEVWAPSRNLPLIRFADRVESIAASGIDLAGLPDQEPPAGLLERLRNFDSIISWYGANREEFREWTRKSELPFQFLDALPSGAGPRPAHPADFYLRQAGGAGRAVPHIECPAERGDYAVIHPFSGSARKNWPLERFRELARRIEPVRWCAGPGEKLEGAVRFDDLWDLACWLASARLYIGNDSGITHLAAAVGTPVVALFGPTDPAIWAPRGPRVRIVKGETMDKIGLDEVAESVVKWSSV